MQQFATGLISDPNNSSPQLHTFFFNSLLLYFKLDLFQYPSIMCFRYYVLICDLYDGGFNSLVYVASK
jgi:hypothetical protein